MRAPNAVADSGRPVRIKALHIGAFLHSLGGKAEGGSEAINFNNAPKAALREFPRSGLDGRD